VTLLGDAIHTMSPGRGEGANVALRDAQLLRHALVEVATNGASLAQAKVQLRPRDAALWVRSCLQCKVVVRMTQRGTHQGTVFGLAATGKQVSIAGIAIFRLRNGQIVEEWLITDQLGVMQQLGAREGWKETP
jgi:SnoaL-like polyketide cyclase/FAD binding domain